MSKKTNSKLQAIIDTVGYSPSSIEEIGKAVIDTINARNPGYLVGLALQLNYSNNVSNSHSCPHNGTTNWGNRNKDAPTGYPGLSGRIWFRLDPDKEHSFNFLQSVLIHTGSGGAGGYSGPWAKADSTAYELYKKSKCRAFRKYQPNTFSYGCEIFLDDWPEFKKQIEKTRVFEILSHGNDSALTNKKFEFGWFDPAHRELDKKVLKLYNGVKSDRKIIGIAGLIGSGKGTAAAYLTNNYNFTEKSFADKLKTVVGCIFGWPKNMIDGITPESREWRNEVDEWWSKRLNIPDFTPRRALQLIGTNTMRDHFNDDIWVGALEKSLLSDENNVIISDVRFPNEIEMIKRMGGTVIRIKRNDPDWVTSGEDLSRRSDLHPSEYSWIGCDIDYTIENDGTKADLYKKLDDFYEEMLLSKK